MTSKDVVFPKSQFLLLFANCLREEIEALSKRHYNSFELSENVFMVQLFHKQKFNHAWLKCK